MSCNRIAVAAILSLVSTGAAAQQSNDETNPTTPTSQPVSPEAVEKLRRKVTALEKKLSAVTDQLEESELEKLRNEASEEAARAPEADISKKDREFLWGALALQKLNPEISLSADIVGGVILDNDGRFYAGQDDRSGMPVREVGLHIQHVLDPYSLFKSALCVIPEEGFELEEVYISWFGLIKSLSLTVGRFRQDFGVLNRWHGHDLDQVNYPLAMQQVLGEEGLVGNGISIKWFMPPLWAHSNELTLQLTDGENETLFSGRYFSVPVVLLHLRNYYDLTDSTYLDLGLTGVFGFNNRRGYVDDTVAPARFEDEPWRKTYLGGVNLTLYWSPLQQAKYRSLTFRSELYFAAREQPEAQDPDSLQYIYSAGFYTYLQYQLSARWFIGARFDLVRPTVRDTDDLAWDIVPYLTFWQSEFVYLRLEYQHGQNIPYQMADEQLGRRTDNRVLLQIDFAAGPHKHEKY